MGTVYRSVYWLDFPPSEKYEEGYKKIVQYLCGGINGFQKVHVIKRNINIGAGKNASFLVEEALETFDRFICIEDDNIVSRDFLEYMDKCVTIHSRFFVLPVRL